jgi:hypothetical protein
LNPGNALDVDLSLIGHCAIHQLITRTQSKKMLEGGPSANLNKFQCELQKSRLPSAL